MVWHGIITLASYALVAQGIERLTPTQKAAGSIPARRTKTKPPFWGGFVCERITIESFELHPRKSRFLNRERLLIN